MVDSVDDEVLALIFRAVPAPDRLRCEEVCVRWRRVLTNHSEFKARLVLPPDPLDDSLVETTEEGWSPWREEARDDTLRAASAKATTSGLGSRASAGRCSRIGCLTTTSRPFRSYDQIRSDHIRSDSPWPRSE